MGTPCFRAASFGQILEISSHPERNIRHHTLEIPQRNINSRQRAHQNRSTTVKSHPIPMLPDMFNITSNIHVRLFSVIPGRRGRGGGFLLCLHTNKANRKGIKTSLNSFRVAFKRCLTPSDIALFVRDLDKKPPGWDSEVDDLFDWCHFLPILLLLRQLQY